MKQAKYFLIFLIAVFTKNLANAATIQASFDCYKANATIEKLICASQKLRYVDYKMAVYFKQAERNLAENKKATLLADQRKWLKNRYSQCKIPPSLTSQSYIYQECLYNLYKKQNFSLFKEIYQKSDQKPFVNIIGSLNFADFRVTGPVTKTTMEQLPSVRIDGDGQFFQGFKGRTGRAVNNCAEYWKYGIDAENTYQMAMAGFFSTTCDPLAVLMKIRKPTISYIKGFSLADISLMPLSFLPIMTDEEQDVLNTLKKQGITVEDLIKKGQVKFIKKSPYSIILYYQDMTAYINEIARGDFTGDGVDSMLVTIGLYAPPVYKTGLITRLGNKQQFQLITPIPQSQK